jgi:hypothetical protein
MDMLVRLLISRPAFDEMLTMGWNLAILIDTDDSDSVEQLRVCLVWTLESRDKP